MNLLLDSSTLYSAIAHEGRVAELVDILIEQHHIVLSDYIVKELQRNLSSHFTGAEKDEVQESLDTFTAGCTVEHRAAYEDFLAEAEEQVSEKDAPILACAMLPTIDMLITSDQELQDINVGNVEILSPSEARERFVED